MKLFLKEIRILKPDHYTNKTIFNFAAYLEVLHLVGLSPGFERSLFSRESKDQTLQGTKCKVEEKKWKHIFLLNTFSRCTGYSL